MCGRYAIIDGKRVLATFPMLQQASAQKAVFAGLPQYNASPMQKLPVVAMRGGTLTIGLMQWWLVPHWSKEPKTQFSTFNAKAETLAKSRLFSPYFKGSRCLIPADGFYEWKKTSLTKTIGGKSKTVVEKQPMCIRMKDDAPFMFAGLFSVWKNEEKGEEVPTFTIITTQPNTLLEPIHNRMPVILQQKDHERWLDREYHDTEALAGLLTGFPASRMKADRVSRVVSSSQNNVPECLEPVRAEET